MKRLTILWALVLSSLPCSALETSQDAYAPVQWSPPEQAWRDYQRFQYEQRQRDIMNAWRQRGGQQVQPRYPNYDNPRGPTGRCYYNVYRVLVCD
jgi:hypothetical protein